MYILQTLCLDDFLTLKWLIPSAWFMLFVEAFDLHFLRLINDNQRQSCFNLMLGMFSDVDIQQIHSMLLLLFKLIAVHIIILFLFLQFFCHFKWLSLPYCLLYL